MGLWGAFMGLWGAFDCRGVLIKVVDHFPFNVLVVSYMFCNIAIPKLQFLMSGGLSWAYGGSSDCLGVLIKVRYQSPITF